MKSILIMILSVAVGFGAVAQSGGGPGQPPKKQQTTKAEKMAQLKADLNLTDAQVQQLTALHEKYGPKMQELKSNTTLNEEQKKAAFKELHQAKKAEMKTILSEEQYEKFKQMKHDHMKQGRTDFMKTELNLTDAQVTQMQALHEKYKPKMTAIKGDANLSDEQKKEAMKALHKAKQEEMKTILTKEQLEKFQEIKKQHHGKGGNHKPQPGGKQ